MIAAFLVFAGVFCFLPGLRPHPETAVIRVNGEIFEIVPLNEDRDVEIYSGGVLKNIVRIKDCKAFMLYSSCPDKRCTKQNYFIVCLPNKVTVTLTKESKNGFDTII